MGGVEGLPFTQLASEEPVAGLAHATPAYVVKDCLRNLKMGFWPWEWSPTDSYGFVNAAQAALGQVGEAHPGSLLVRSSSSSPRVDKDQHLSHKKAVWASRETLCVCCSFNEAAPHRQAESAHAQLLTHVN